MPKTDLSSLSSNPFRSPQNVPLTKALFFETTLADKSTVLYSLKEKDHTVDGKTYPSLYRLYMEANDPTEYAVATKYFDGWYHWEVLCRCSWFQPYVNRWRSELELRMKSKALHRIMGEAGTNSKNALAANKYLLEKGWEPKESPQSKRGRPSKEQIKQAASDLARAETTLLDDFSRIQILKQ